MVKYPCYIERIATHSPSNCRFEKLLYQNVVLHDEEQAARFIHWLRLRHTHNGLSCMSISLLYLDGHIHITTMREILAMCIGINTLSFSSQCNELKRDIIPLLSALDRLPLKVLSLLLRISISSSAMSRFNIFAKLTHVETNDFDMLLNFDT